MSEYVHLNIICLDGKSLWISFNIISYTPTELTLACSWRSNCKNKRLFRNDNDIRCFDCIPWGNRNISSEFTRVGKLLR